MKRRVSILCVFVLLTGVLSGCEEREDTVSFILEYLNQDEPDYKDAYYVLDGVMGNDSYEEKILCDYMKICATLVDDSELSEKDIVENQEGHMNDTIYAIRILYEKRAFLPGICQEKITKLYEIVMNNEKELTYFTFLRKKIIEVNEREYYSVSERIVQLRELENLCYEYEDIFYKKTGMHIETGSEQITERRIALEENGYMGGLDGWNDTNITLRINSHMKLINYYTINRRFIYYGYLDCIRFIVGEKVDE